MSAWTKIAHTELPSAQSEITFDNIPQSYTDLIIFCSLRAQSNDMNFYYKFNNDTGNISGRNLVGVGSGTAITQSGSVMQIHSSRIGTSDTFGNAVIYVPNYTSNLGKYSGVDGVSEEDSAASYQHIVSAYWNDTSAITRVDIYPQFNNLVQYSSATIYGISKGSSGGVTVS